MPPPRLRPVFGFTPGLARKGRPPLRAGRPFLDLPEKFGEGGKPRRDRGGAGGGAAASKSSRSRSEEQGGVGEAGESGVGFGGGGSERGGHGAGCGVRS